MQSSFPPNNDKWMKSIFTYFKIFLLTLLSSCIHSIVAFPSTPPTLPPPPRPFRHVDTFRLLTRFVGNKALFGSYLRRQCNCVTSTNIRYIGHWHKRPGITSYVPRQRHFCRSRSQDTIPIITHLEVCPMLIALDVHASKSNQSDQDFPQQLQPKHLEKMSPSLSDVQSESLSLEKNTYVPLPSLTTQCTTSSITVPTYRQLFVFLSTTVLIWLTEPLLSLVDSTVVGFTSSNSVMQLAALGPATTLFDSIMYNCYFLAIATTSKLAPEFAVQNYRTLQRTTSHLLGVAVVMGLIAMIICYGIGNAILHIMVATGPDTAILVHYAKRYVWIRASVAIVSVLGMVMQNFCLVTQDVVTPAKSVAIAFAFNVLGDILLRHMGIQGAAIATALSGILASSFLFHAVRKRVREWRRLELDQSREKFKAEYNQTNQIDVAMSPARTPINHSSTLHVTIQAGDSQKWEAPPSVPFLSFPDLKSFLELLKVAGPIFLVVLVKSACYSALNVRCANFGVVALATHCILMRVFFFYVTFGDAISQAAQSFLPATLYPKPLPFAFRTISKRLFVISSIVSMTNSNAVLTILKKYGHFLANDLSIVHLMSDQSVFMALSVLLHPFITLLEGTVVASRDFRTLLATYGVTLGLHFGILRFACDSFSEIWRAFFLFQFIRFGNFAIHACRRYSLTHRANAAVILFQSNMNRQ